MKKVTVTILYILVLHLQCIAQARDLTAQDFEYKGMILRGPITQGAMIKGMSSEVKAIRVFDKSLELNEGRFVFGIGRDAKALIPLDITWSDDSKEIIQLKVIQRQYVTQRIDGVDNKYVRELDEKLKARTRKEASQVWQARQTYRKAIDYIGPFIWPAEGPITGVYGSQRIFNGVPKRPHYGLDIAGPTGTPVVAPAKGKVTLVHHDMYYSGGTLIIDHGYGVSSTFIHLSKIHVEEGQNIKAGQRIADIGATGRATGPHLDWRINWFDQRLDPALVLPARAAEE